MIVMVLSSFNPDVSTNPLGALFVVKKSMLPVSLLTAGRRSRWDISATEPARPTRWEAASYWSTRNRRSPTGLAWLDAVGADHKSFAHRHLGVGFDANDAADLGSDPHLAQQKKIHHPGVPEWGSDSNSAAHSTTTTTLNRLANCASPITGQRQLTGHSGLLGSFLCPAGRERAGEVSGRMTTCR